MKNMKVVSKKDTLSCSVESTFGILWFSIPGSSNKQVFTQILLPIQTGRKSPGILSFFLINKLFTIIFKRSYWKYLLLEK